jgi:hypothetical protein
MRFRFSLLMRPFLAAVLGLNVVALGLGRWAAPAPSWRSLNRFRHSNINKFFYSSNVNQTHYLDPETGRIGTLELPEAERLEQLSWSPWRDEAGQAHVVGQWSSRSGAGTNMIAEQFGLARCTFPEGRVLDRVVSETVPNSPPCWFPGTSSRILFPAPNGAIYRFDFEGADSNDGSSRSPGAQPTPLAWKCDITGGSRTVVNDMTWPVDTRLGGRLLVSLCRYRQEGDHCFIARPEIWWLRLDHDGTAIDQAARLTIHGSVPPSGLLERWPVVTTQPDGRLVLAYLAHDEGRMTWDLRVAPIAFEGDNPVVYSDQSRLLCDNCAPSAPAFSADGRWINFTVLTDRDRSRAQRLPFDDLLRPPG